MKLHRSLVLLSAVLLLAGCAGAPEHGSEGREVIDLLDYYGRLAAMPAEVQQREYQNIQDAFERKSDDAQRLRLALVLTLPQAPWRDDVRALKLVEAIVDATPERVSARRDLALAMHRLIGERFRALRDEQYKAEDAQKKLQALLAERQRQLREEHRKAEELQEKLDALLAIDRNTRLKNPRR